MTTAQARGMLIFHQRAAQAYRQMANDPKVSKRERERVLNNAHAADLRAAECQAILQVARMTEATK